MDNQAAKKIVELETSLGLLQHDFDKQNQMIVLDSRRIEKLERELRVLAASLETYRTTSYSQPIPNDPPPHY